MQGTSRMKSGDLRQLGYRCPAAFEIIHIGIWAYYLSCMSLHDVKDLLAE